MSPKIFSNKKIVFVVFATLSMAACDANLQTTSKLNPANKKATTAVQAKTTAAPAAQAVAAPIDASAEYPGDWTCSAGLSDKNVCGSGDVITISSDNKTITHAYADMTETDQNGKSISCDVSQADTFTMKSTDSTGAMSGTIQPGLLKVGAGSTNSTSCGDALDVLNKKTPPSIAAVLSLPGTDPVSGSDELQIVTTDSSNNQVTYVYLRNQDVNVSEVLNQNAPTTPALPAQAPTTVTGPSSN